MGDNGEEQMIIKSCAEKMCIEYKATRTAGTRSERPNTYCFGTAKIVKRTRMHIAFIVHFLYCSGAWGSVVFKALRY
jgi:hypothetical protein